MTGDEWTFAMIDLAGFTALTEAHGDETAADLAVGFADLAKASLGPSDRFVKALGDAVLLASPEPGAGIRLVQRILTSCDEREQYLVTRSALHHGPATRRGEDFFGAAVNLTARLSAHASGGQILATTPVAAVARELGLRVEELGAATFKNVSEETLLHSIAMGLEQAMESIDPVCRMRVNHDRAAGFLRSGGVDYWFCSLKCAETFAHSQGSR